MWKTQRRKSPGSFRWRCAWSSAPGTTAPGCTSSPWHRTPVCGPRPACSGGSPTCSSTCRAGGDPSGPDRKSRSWPACRPAVRTPPPSPSPPGSSAFGRWGPCRP
uniref:Uncharacterized protein n=1 Tax=Ixodes ricinus TaxID=34613 RepID=A0A6B0UIK4_IXORI